MIKLFEMIICQYYRCNKWILRIIIVLFLLLLKRIIKQEGTNIKKVKLNFLYALFVAIIGSTLYLMDISLGISYENFNVMIFGILCFLIVLLAIYQYTNCRDFSAVGREICKNFRYVLFLQLFILALSAHLDIWEYCAAWLGTVIFDLLKEEKIDTLEKESMESDQETDKLFPTRKRQLEKFIPILRQQKDEPYAVMIYGDWGSGKSSFMKALKKEMKDEAFFINVKAGAEKTVSEIMDEICSQIAFILKENDIYVEDRALDEYFSLFSEETGSSIKIFTKLMGIFRKNQENDALEYLKNKLKRLEKTIYIVIDDLDRCDADYQNRMFKVIRESLNLNNCKTIFLIDEKHFLNGKDDSGDNYLRKYISCALELCTVDYHEIVNELIDEIIKKYDITQIDEEYNWGEIRNYIYTFHDKVIQEIKNLEKSLNDVLKERKEDKEEKEKINKEIEKYNQLMRKISTETGNPRIVKKYLKGIKKDLRNINIALDVDKDNKQNIVNNIERYVKAIVGVQYLRWFMPEKYVEIKTQENLDKYDDCLVNRLLEIVQGIYSAKEEEELQIVYYVLHKIDLDDFPQIMKKRDKILSELRNSECRNRENITEYLEYVYTYDDMLNILNLLDQKYVIVSDILGSILDKIKESESRHSWTNHEMLNLASQLKLKLKNCKLTETERNNYSQRSKQIADDILYHNYWRIVDVLVAKYGVSKVNPNDLINVDGIKDVYEYLEKMVHGKVENINDPKDQLCATKKILSELKKGLIASEENLKEVGLNSEVIFGEIETALDAYSNWLEMGESFYAENNARDSIVEIIQNGKKRIDEIIDNPDELENLLVSLYEAYDKKTIIYRKYVDILVKTTRELDWIDEQTEKYCIDRKGINELLKKNLNNCCQAGKHGEDVEREVQNLRTYVYRFICNKNHQVSQENRTVNADNAPAGIMVCK